MFPWICNGFDVMGEKKKLLFETTTFDIKAPNRINTWRLIGSAFLYYIVLKGLSGDGHQGNHFN